MRRLVHFPPRACWNLALVRACTAHSPHEALPAYGCTVAPHMRAVGDLHTSPHRTINAAPQKRTAESPSPSRSFSDPQVPEVDFYRDPRMSQDDVLFGSGRRCFCVPGQVAQPSTSPT